jgi:uncharacterized lipoprotein YmbA
MIARLRAMAFVALACAACGSSPDPVYYAMRAVDPATPRHRAWAHLIEVRKVGLPGYLDRTEIVRKVAHYRLGIAGGQSWSEPLTAMLGRLLSTDLANRLEGSFVFSEASPISTAPDAVVGVDIQRFDCGDDDTLVMDAEVSVEKAPAHTIVFTKRVALQTRVGASDTTALVAAMSSQVGQLADVIAVALATSDSAGGS